MRIILEPTTRFVDLVDRLAGEAAPMQGRVWQGVTDSGVELVAVIVRVATRADNDLSEFVANLRPVEPGEAAVEAIPTRLIL